MLNQKVRGLSWWRTIYYVPAVVPVVASAYLFSYLFNVDTGLVNLLLKMVNIKGPNWFGSPTWALRTFIIMNLWVSGGGMIVYLAALQGVPTSLYDAAEIDGANAWQRLWHITLPMTSPLLAVHVYDRHNRFRFRFLPACLSSPAAGRSTPR